MIGMLRSVTIAAGVMVASFASASSPSVASTTDAVDPAEHVSDQQPHRVAIVHDHDEHRDDHGSTPLLIPRPPILMIAIPRGHRRNTARRSRRRSRSRCRRGAAICRRSSRTVGIGEARAARLRPLARRQGVARDEPDRRLRLPGVRVARPAGRRPEPVRVLRERRQGDRRGGDTARATPELFERMTVDELRELSDFELGQLGRLTHPMMLDGSRHYRAISWDDAIAVTADTLRAVGPAHKRVLHVGAHVERSGVPLPARGADVRDEQFSRLLEHVPRVERRRARRSHRHRQGHRLARRLRALRPDLHRRPESRHESPAHADHARAAAKRGATIVSINPLREVGLSRFSHPQHPLDLLTGGVELAKHFVQVQIGGDQAFFLGLGKALVERADAGDDVLDRGFLADKTGGVRAVARSRACDAVAGDRAQRRRRRDNDPRDRGAVRRVALDDRVLGDGHHATQACRRDDPGDRQLTLLRGNLGSPGAGLCPVRGHSNVQGDRTMGI